MNKYLLDTNICIYFLKGLYDLDKTISKAGPHNCFISEITVAELKFGVEKSEKRKTLHEIVEAFIPKFIIIPIYNSLDIYATQKARLRKSGIIIDDFDLLIGATAIANSFVMVTNNIAHLSRVEGIVIEDWTKMTNR